MPCHTNTTAPRFLTLLLAVLAPLAALQAQSIYATSYTFTTYAGSGFNGSADGTSSTASFSNIVGLAVDGSGNIYVADILYSTIRKITPAGVVTTLAGSPGNSGSTDGIGSVARFFHPTGIAVDGSGNIFVTDQLNFTIRKITSAGEVTTFAGAALVNGSVDGTGSTARFSSPYGIAVDASGNLYVGETNGVVRKITAGGMVTTIAGAAGSIGSNDGTGSAARFSVPTGVAVDRLGNIYVADTLNCTIRKITSGGVVTTLAGNIGSGSNDGTGSAARFKNPYGVAVDGSGNVYVSDTENSTIRRITPDGVVTTLGGTAGSSGSTNGTGGAARFWLPYGLAVDGSGTIFVADTGNCRVRKGVPPAGFPVFTIQPANQVVVAGSSITLSATAGGAPSPTYQWQKDSVNIIGAIGSAYTIMGATEGDVGGYTVVATNSFGSVTSSIAELTVIVAPGNAVITITVE